MVWAHVDSLIYDFEDGVTCMSTAGPRYLSAFHQYEGQEVEQHAHKMHCMSV